MNKPDAVNKTLDIVLWLAVAIVTAAAFFCTYHYQFSSPVLSMIWVSWMVLTAVFVFFTSVGQKVYHFAKESKIEMQKVVWPTRHETIQTTSIVMVMVAITGLVLWGIDAGMMWAIGKITHLG